jgi:hypothetical protein
MAKRSRELARQQKREDKLERQETRSATSTKLAPDDEALLLEEFADLNDRYAADLVSQAQFDEERNRILVALGIETGEES